jgi:hypothetical protein
VWEGAGVRGCVCVEGCEGEGVLEGVSECVGDGRAHARRLAHYHGHAGEHALSLSVSPSLSLSLALSVTVSLAHTGVSVCRPPS